jgi:lipoyl(octanoyl) transferase
MQSKIVTIQDLQNIEYQAAWDYQTSLFEKTIAIKTANREHGTQNSTSNYLLTCEHPHVYTIGKSGKKEHLLLNQNQLAEKEATFYESNRGGDITYHGPGQLVVYPILDLDNFFTDIHKYMRCLEEAVIKTCEHYSIKAGRVQGLTGVWLGDSDLTYRKICAMGVKTSRWVTMHGLALNVNTNLSYFNNIVPCGISDKQVTSMAKEIGSEVNLEEVKQLFIGYFEQIFECSLQEDIEHE